MKLVVFVAINVVFNSFASVFIKSAVSKTLASSGGALIPRMLRLVVSPAFLSGTVFFGLSLLAYSLVLQRLKLSTAYPLTVTLSVILVTVVSKVMLKEPISIHQVAGIALISGGVWLVVK